MRTIFCFIYLLLARIPSIARAAHQLAELSKKHKLAPWKEYEIKKAETDAVIAKLKANR